MRKNFMVYKVDVGLQYDWTKIENMPNQTKQPVIFEKTLRTF